MSRATRSRTALRGLWSRTPRAAVALVVVTLLGWTLLEVVPRYSVERHRGEAPGRLDHPSFLIGDCPYYRATLVSLLEDHDLDVRNNLIASAMRCRRTSRSGGTAPSIRSIRSCSRWRRCRSTSWPATPGLLAFNLAQLGALVLVMWIGARRYAPGLGRVRGDDLVRVRDAAAVRRVQLRARRPVDVAGRGRRRRLALRPQPHGRRASGPVAVGEVDEPGVLPGRGGGAGGAARMARVAALRRGGGGSRDGLARAELAHVRVAVRHALRSRAGRQQGAAGSSSRRTGRSSRFRSGGACGRS